MRPARVGGLVAAVFAVVSLVGVSATVALSAPSRPARATATSAEAAALARQAVTDDDALTQLRAIRTIDGKPVRLDVVTDQLGADRAARLTALAAALGSGGSSTASPAEARASARQVLSRPKYQPNKVPRPFKGVLEMLARPLRPVLRQIGRWLRPIRDLPFGAFILFVIAVGIFAGCLALLISRRSRAAIRRERQELGLVDPEADPDQLDAAARAAEDAGDLVAAVRLRYEAGLVRLVRADRVELRVETTATGAAQQVGLPAMDALTADFEQVVYGGRAATPDDIERSRSGWAEVLGVRSRR